MTVGKKNFGEYNSILEISRKTTLPGDDLLIKAAKARAMIVREIWRANGVLKVIFADDCVLTVDVHGNSCVQLHPDGAKFEHVETLCALARLFGARDVGARVSLLEPTSKRVLF